MRPVFTIIFGLFLSIMGIVLLVHDAGYIFAGNTVDLNEVFENNEQIPEHQYVTYTCWVSLGNYAETNEYYGFIPTGKTQQFAVLTENDMIISAEISRKDTIMAMNLLTDATYSEDEDVQPVPVTLTGNLEFNDSEMNGYLSEYFEGVDFDEEGITLTGYSINTTRTRLLQGGLCLGMFLLGGIVIIVGIRKKRMQ